MRAPRVQKVERLAASLHFVGAPPAGKRTVFVEEGCVARAVAVAESAECWLATAADSHAAVLALHREDARALMPSGALRRGAGGAAQASDDDDEDDASDEQAPQAAHAAPPAAARGCVTGGLPAALLACL